MINKKQFDELTQAIELRKRADDTDFYCYKDNLTIEISKGLRDVIFEIDQECHNLDLSYKIANDALNALNALSEVDYEDLGDFDQYELDGDFASVYTQTRLGYLNVWNEGDISDLVKEYGNINTACAVWYDEQVRGAINLLLDFIKE